MSLDADLIVDRRRMRRKLTFWRVLAIVLVVIGIAGAAGLASSRTCASRISGMFHASSVAILR